MASFDGPRLPREAYNHDRRIPFFRHKQRGKARRVGGDDDARRRYLHKAMIKGSGLQLLEGQDWRYMSESDDDDDDDDDDNGDDVDTTPTPTPTTPPKRECTASSADVQLSR
jgi:hypothetical protein